MSENWLGIFCESREKAEQAVRELQGNGFENATVGVDYPSSDSHIDFSDDADVGVGEGVGFGLAFGALVGLAAMVIPGFGPVIAAGPLASALVGAAIGSMSGALTGGVVAGLVHVGAKDDLFEELRQQNWVVTVSAPSEGIPRAMEILEKYEV